MKFCLIINHSSMNNVGGIEKYLYEVIKYCINNDIRIIWMYIPHIPIARSFESLLLGDRVERVVCDKTKFHWFLHDRLPLVKEEEYTIFNANPYDMVISECIIKEYKGYKIKTLYAVPDTTGKNYFIERNFKCEILNKCVYKILKNMTQRWEDNKSLVFFAATHPLAQEENYGITIQDKEKKILKSASILPEIDLDNLNTLAKNRKPFRIMTVGRFDFPHKGYMLGLVESFARLKNKYNNLELHILGSGPDAQKLLDKIKELPVRIQKDIILHGQVLPEMLDSYYKKNHLNISVAGAATLGARAGIITIVARNYCYNDCEAYGFYDNAYLKTTCTDPGSIVDEYIERVINMSDKEFVNSSLRCYNRYKSRYNYNPLFIFERSKLSTLQYSCKEIILMKIIKRLVKINNHIKIL